MSNKVLLGNPLVIREAINSRGFAVLNNLVCDHVDSLVNAVASLPETERVRKRNEVYGIRDLFSILPELQPLLQLHAISEIANPILGPEWFAVRSIYFDKPASANWMVPWHQDLTIAVKHRIDTPGFGPWSVKANIPHVQPPSEFLERMLTIRIHLDDCDQSNGALEVVPGSHSRGRLSAQEISALRNVRHAEVCEVRRGGCVIMRPLLLHASKPSETAEHRRVIHLELAAEDLPNGLEWHEKRFGRRVAS